MNSSTRLLHPGIKALLTTSALIAIGLFFWDQWTSGGPTFFPDHVVNPLVLRTVPDWLGLPQDESAWLPLIGVIILGFILRFIPASNASRALIKPLLLFLAVRYFLWRTTSSLNFSHPFSTAFSLVLYGAEIVCLISFALHTLQTIVSTDRKRKKQADRYEQDILEKRYLPSVDILVPSYNEPDYIVRRTVIGCQAIDYPNKRIYILDDTRRPHIRELAKELGCEYITRPNNDHAKAGNLNNALPKTHGELIALMDADFVPFRNFLNRTVGFFQDPNISLVQTPQNFYNPDFHARNLGLDRFLPNDLETFFGSIQPHRDSLNSVICCGSCYVVRRTSIEAIGGYYTKCCVEDYQTSLNMLMQGQRLAYLNETLSMGESTRMCADFVDQRLRWLQGNFQVYYCKDLPLWQKLSWGQRSFLFEQWVHCLSCIVRLIFLLSPLVSLYTGAAPYLTSLNEIIYFFLPFWVMSAIVQGWSTDYRSSYFWTEVYGLIMCVPSVKRMIAVLWNPFGKVSKVTRKGVNAEGRSWNWPIITPLLFFLVANTAGLALKYGGWALGWWELLPEIQQIPIIFWLTYNNILIIVAILASIDQPVRRQDDRFPIHAPGELKIDGIPMPILTQNISEGGLSAYLHPEDWQASGGQWGDRVKLMFDLPHIPNAKPLRLVGRIIRSRSVQGAIQVSIEFENMDLDDRRKLIRWLYCEMHDFKARRRPGGLDNVFAMLTAILQLRSLTHWYRTSRRWYPPEAPPETPSPAPVKALALSQSQNLSR